MGLNVCRLLHEFLADTESITTAKFETCDQCRVKAPHDSLSKLIIDGHWNEIYDALITDYRTGISDCFLSHSCRIVTFKVRTNRCHDL